MALALVVAITSLSAPWSTSATRRNGALVRWAVLVGVAGLLLVVLAAATAGLLGSLATCGADKATVCIVWPGLASDVVWVTFIGLIVGLTVTQARHWRSVSLARREGLALTVLLVVALAIRLWRLDQALVGYDEASAASLVDAWRLDGLFPLTGIVSSINVPNPPAWPYLLAIGLLVVDSPWTVLVLGIAASMLCIALTWWLGRRWIGPWAALAAAAFYATNFWSALLGRSGWQPVFLQVPLILCLDALLILAVRRRPWAVVLACGWLGLMVQLHYIAGLFALMLPLAMWPARHVLRPVHLAAAVLVGLLLLTPFLIYELHPTVRFHDVLAVASDAGAGAHFDLESWNLFWTVAGGRGAAGLGASDTERLQQALGRWSNVALIGIPLVAAGALAAIGRWPGGWRGVLLVAWMLTPVVGLVRHTIGVIFHYLYLAVPGMALSVGVLAEWSRFPRRIVPRLVVWSGLVLYATVSTITLLVVVNHVASTGEYPSQGRPLALNLAATEVVRAVRPAQATVLIGGSGWRTEVLRFTLGYGIPSRNFDDCGPLPIDPSAIYLVDDDQSPAARALTDAGAPVLGRVPRPDGAFLIFGAPGGSDLANAPAVPSCHATPETDPAVRR